MLDVQCMGEADMGRPLSTSRKQISKLQQSLWSQKNIWKIMAQHVPNLDSELDKDADGGSDMDVDASQPCKNFNTI